MKTPLPKSSIQGLKTTEFGCTLRVHVHPKSGKPGISLRNSGELHLHVSEAATDDRANRAVQKLLGKSILRVAPSRIEILRGHRSRIKTISIDLDLEIVQQLLHKALDA